MESLNIVLNPGVLFFLLGFFATLAKSNLAVPDPVVRFLSLYLMLAIGYRGGVSLYESEMSGDGLLIIGIILLMSALVPWYAVLLLRKRVGLADAAAIGATYGSNSTLTYITSAGFLTAMEIPYAGYMTVALVVMETPAIVIALLMARMPGGSKGGKTVGTVMRDALTDGTLLVLVGSMVIGWLIRAMGTEHSPLAAFIEGDMFTGMLVFFLLYMGTVVGAKIKEMKQFPPALGVFAVTAPLVNGAIAVALSKVFGFSHGDAFLLTILCASASYIVAPAILRDTLPEASPARYLSMSIGITFPLNILIGIPAFWWVIQAWL